ncbi:unnamed protein product [Calicophoron daubneyi]|uniref:Uncharacterized protein n=1 Tax=Calicophoron daubneyi TaxID=300641 RepID=A0AAV2TSB9_CALDB
MSCNIETVVIHTEKCGDFTVYIQGNKPKNAPVIITVPDLGCDHTYYSRFLDMYLRGRFCWCHIELPGQSYGSDDWIPPDTDGEYKGDRASSGDLGGMKIAKDAYPTMQELAVGVRSVLKNLEISQAFLFGEGAGANLLSRVAILCDSLVLGVVLIHGRCTQSGPLKLLREKMRNWRSAQLDQQTEKFLLDHRFGTQTLNQKMSGTLKAEFQQYRSYLAEKVNIRNLNYLTYSYAHRTSLSDMINDFKCPILLVSGTASGHRSGVRTMFELLNKSRKDDPISRSKVELVEIDGATLPLVEAPEKVAETTLYFLQGLGLVTSVRTASMSSSGGHPSPRDSFSGTPEQRTCATSLVNLDAKPSESTSPPITNLESDSLPETSPPQASPEMDSVRPLEQPSSGVVRNPRYLNRQLSMAELDLPRGPDALSTSKTIQHSGPHSPQRLGHTHSFAYQ